MGLLDDAIREHLELKRRHGADPEEVSRQEPRRSARPQRGEFAQPEGAADADAEADAEAEAPSPPTRPPSQRLRPGPRRSRRRPRRRSGAGAEAPPPEQEAQAASRLRATRRIPGCPTRTSPPPARSRSRPPRARTCWRRRPSSSRRRPSTTGCGSSRSRRATSTGTSSARSTGLLTDLLRGVERPPQAADGGREARPTLGAGGLSTPHPRMGRAGRLGRFSLPRDRLHCVRRPSTSKPAARDNLRPESPDGWPRQTPRNPGPRRDPRSSRSLDTGRAVAAARPGST